MKKKVLVTGGAGFIGSNLVKLILKEKPDWQVINLDLLTYAGNLESLEDVKNHPNYTFVKGDVADTKIVDEVIQGCWGVLHLAAESHVDRSIEDPGPFLMTNIMGTSNLLNMARKHGIERFVQISTDEVYGALKPEEPAFTESNHIKPNSPYSASKASADLLCRAYFKTFGMPVCITRCSNNLGPYQFPEKLIPLVIHNALNDKPIPVYGDGQQIRDWLFVEDHCSAMVKVLEEGKAGEVYNVGGKNEVPNLDIVRIILRTLGKPESLITYVKDRPGHDRRYAIDNEKIERELGWYPKYSFEESIKLTIDWYLNNQNWVAKVMSGEYQDYYQRQYAQR